MLATGAGFFLAGVLLFWTRTDLSVVVSNDTSQPFRAVTVAIGKQHEE